MRKLFVFMMVTPDGFFEGPNREIDWHNADGEFNDYAIDMLDNSGTLLFGRVTYQLMAGFWPSEEALKNDPVVAGKMNSLPKIVVSKSMKKADWNNTRLISGNVAEEILKLKRQPGKDIALLGSSDLAVSLTGHGLIDEFRIMVNPVVLGSGKTLFRGLNERLNLKLIHVRTFQSGNVLMRYEPAGK